MRNKIILFVGIILASILALYLYLKNKTSETSNTTLATGNSILDFLTGKTKTTDENIPNENNSNTSSGNDNSTGGNNTPNPPPVIMGASEPITTRYYYAVIYLKYDGYTAPSGAIGYLSNGEILYYSQVEYKNGRYENRQNPVEPPTGGNEV